VSRRPVVDKKTVLLVRRWLLRVHHTRAAPSLYNSSSCSTTSDWWTSCWEWYGADGAEAIQSNLRSMNLQVAATSQLTDDLTSWYSQPSWLQVWRLSIGHRPSRILHCSTVFCFSFFPLSLFGFACVWLNWLRPTDSFWSHVNKTNFDLIWFDWKYYVKNVKKKRKRSSQLRISSKLEITLHDIA